MKRTTEVIEKLSDDEKIELIYSYEQFERDVFIGDCKLRELAKSLPLGDQYVTNYMTSLATECYRYFGHLYIVQPADDYFNRTRD